MIVRSRRTLLVMGLMLPLIWASHARARTVRVMESTPVAGAFVDGRNAQYSVRFDGPVDHLASRLSIVRDGRMIETLPVLGDSAADTLFASAPQLAAGRYELRWSARSAPDGEVTEGSIGFTVKQP